MDSSQAVDSSRNPRDTRSGGNVRMSGEGKTRTVWVRAGGIEVGAADVLLDLKLGSEGKYLDSLVRRKVAASIATQRGIAISEEELEEAVASFYADRGAFEEEQIEALRRSLRVDEDQVRAYVGEALLIERAEEVLISDEAVEKRFATEQYGYARAEVEVYVFATAGAAREFILAVREHELEPEGGDPRELVRRDAADEIAAILFTADPGDLVGPAEADDGSHEVYLLRKRQEASLDEDLMEEIREAMFEEIIETELARNPMKFEA